LIACYFFGYAGAQREAMSKRDEASVRMKHYKEGFKDAIGQAREDALQVRVAVWCSVLQWVAVCNHSFMYMYVCLYSSSYANTYLPHVI